MPRTLLLVRHGETAWNREGRLQGWTDTTLTDRGRDQARALAQYLEDAYDVAAIRSSDLARARETADAIAAVVGVDVHASRAWRERGLGSLEGEPYDALVQHPRLSVGRAGTAALDAAPASGETLRGMRDRVLDAWRDVVEGAPDGTVVVSHGGPLYVVLSRVKGLDLLDGLRALDQSNCAINEFRIDGTDVELRRENETPY